MKFRILFGIIFSLSIALGTSLVVQQAHKYYVKDQTTANKVSIESPALSSSYSMTLPTSNGSSGQFLQNNGSGVLSWQTVPSNYANQSFSNLTSPTAVNQDLIPSGTRSLGNSTDKWNSSNLLSEILYGSTSGSITQQAANTTTSYSVKWPASQGAASTFLQNDGAGNLSWAAGGSGANTSLSNLTSPTAINQDLIPSLDHTLGFGSSTKRWGILWGAALTDDGSSMVDVGTGDLFDSTALVSLNWWSRNLRDSSGNIVGNWNTKTLGSAAQKWTVFNSSSNLVGSTSGTLTHQASATTTNHTLTWPASQGGASTVLTNNGSGVLSWATPSAGSPAGSDTQIQYNNAGSFGGSSKFTWTNASSLLGLGGVTSGTLSIKPADTTTSHTLTMPASQGAANTVLTNNGSGLLSWGSVPTNGVTQVNYAYDGITKTLSNGVTDVLFDTNGTGATTVVNLPISSSNPGLEISFSEGSAVSFNDRVIITHQSGDSIFSTNWNTNAFYLHPKNLFRKSIKLKSRWDSRNNKWSWDIVGETYYCHSWGNNTLGTGSPVFATTSINISGDFDITDNALNSKLWTGTTAGWFNGPRLKNRTVYTITVANAAAATVFSTYTTMNFLGSNVNAFRSLNRTDISLSYDFVSEATRNTSTEVGIGSANLTLTASNNLLGFQMTGDTSWNLSSAQVCQYLSSYTN